MGHRPHAPQDAAWAFHISNCGDLDIAGFKKPQSNYRNVLWGVSDLEVVSHAPMPPGVTEVVSRWGWRDEEVGWTWGAADGAPLLEVRVFTSHAHVT